MEWKLSITLEIQKKRKIKMPNFLKISDAEFVYCWLVMSLENWHFMPLCTRLLVEKYSEIQHLRERYNTPRVIKALNLSFEQIQKLQIQLSEFSSDDKYYFCQALVNLMD